MTKEIIKPPEADQAELITSLNGSPFVISGNVELIQDMYQDELKAWDKSNDGRTARVSRAAIKNSFGIVEHIQRPVEGFVGRLAVDLKAAVYDKANGTSFLAALHEKRQLEKDLAMAQSLGLLTVDVCAKHRKAIDDVRNYH